MFDTVHTIEKNWRTMDSINVALDRALAGLSN